MLSSPILADPPAVRTLADLLERLGGIAPERVMAHPPPGTATERDVIEANLRGDGLYELVDGTLVRKAMGFRESVVGAALFAELFGFVRAGKLGLVTGPDGPYRLADGLVRLPVASFVSWPRVPGGRIPEEAIPSLVPDLAVEMPRAGNTAKEMDRKLREFFAAGMRLVWMIDLEPRGV